MMSEKASGTLLNLIDQNLSFEQISVLHKSSALSDSAWMEELFSSHDHERVLTSLDLAKSIKNLLKEMRVTDLLCENQRLNLSSLFQSFHRTMKRQKFSRSAFLKQIYEELTLPIEVVWHFHKENIVSLEKFLAINFQKDSTVMSQIPEAIVRLCKKSECCLELRRRIVFDFIMYFILHTYDQLLQIGSSAAAALKKVSEAMLDCITQIMLKSLHEDRDINPFQLVLPSLNHVVRRQFSEHQLVTFLTSNTHLKVSDVLTTHGNWTFAKAPIFLTDSFTELLCSFCAAEAMDLLKRLLESSELDWRTVLTFTSTCLVYYPEMQQLLSDFIHESISRDLERQEQDGIILGLLLARQGGAEGPHVFPSYSAWFQAEFGSTNSPAASKTSFCFFMKFLTDLVPYESCQVLKAHIQRPPYAPTKCKEILTDYMKLVRARLLELGESPEETSIFGDKQQTDNLKVGGSEVDHDISCALELFSKTNKVPTSVMEASIFKKPYFVGKFLPCLLTPRPLPDEPDMKMEFISALLRAGKLPSAMFSSYEDKCKQMSKQLLDGVFQENDDEEMELLLLSPLQQFETSLNKWRDKVVEEILTHKNMGIAMQHSIVVEKMTSFLSDDLLSKNVSVGTLFSAKIMKVTDLLITIVCQVRGLLLQTECNPSKWLCSLLTSVCQYDCLQRSLCVRIQMLLTAQAQTVELCHIRGLASIVVEMIRNPQLVAGVRVPCNSHCDDFIESLSSHLLLSTSSQQVMFFRFAVMCAEYQILLGEKQLSNWQPRSVIDRMFFLFDRLLPVKKACQMIGNETCDIAQQIFSLEISQDYLIQFNFEKWISLELTVDSYRDVLCISERDDFIDKLFSRFLQSEEFSVIGFFGSCKLLAHVWQSIPWRSGQLRCIKCATYSTYESHYILRLLLRLINLLYKNNNSDSSPPWLLELWLEKLVQDQSSKDIIWNQEINELVRLTSALPSYLMLSNDSRCLRYEPATLDSFISVVNSLWLNNLLDGGVLNSNVVVLCFQIFKACSLTNEAVMHILKNVPAILIALVVNWSKMEALLKQLTTISDDVCGQLISLLQQTSSNNCSLDEILFSEQFTKEIPYLKGLLLFRFLISRSEQDAAKSYQILLTSSDVDMQMLVYCVCCCLCKLTADFLSCQSFSAKVSQLLGFIWNTWPAVFHDNYLTVSAVNSSFSAKSIISVWPITTLRFLSENLSAVTNLQQTDKFIFILLKIYEKCTRFYLSCEPWHTSFVEPFTMNFLSTIKTFLLRQLNCATTDQLLAVNQSTLDSADQEVLIAVTKRLYSLKRK